MAATRIATNQPLSVDGATSKEGQNFSTEDPVGSSSTQISDSTSAKLAESHEHKWVSGPKLWNIIAAITLVCVLVLLDTSIVATVRIHEY